MKFYSLILLLVLGLFFRGYQPIARFNYAHDSDLASWMVKDMLIDGHIRLVGQLTSSPGIFIGPLFYYLLTPFYLFNNFDPGLSVLYSFFIGLISIFSLYYVVFKLHGKKPAVITTFLYAASFALSLTEREVVPTTPVMLWTIWAYYAVNRRNLIIMAILLSLIWHLNLALVLLVPIFAVSALSNPKNRNFKSLTISALCLFVLSLPLFIFESRHNFQQTRALIDTLSTVGTSTSDLPVSFTQKISHVLDYADKNLNNNVFSATYKLPKYLFPALVVLLSIWLAIRKTVPPHFPFLVLAWQSLFILFFTLHPINLSEYYLNGMNIIWLIILGLFLSSLPKYIYLPVITVYFLINLASLLSYRPTNIGYLQKTALVDFIKQDAARHSYPCISISYMTDIGYNFGYRYFFYLAGLHVNQPQSGSPVYTIVFPHSRASRIDESFGSLGLIRPDYSKYTAKEVKLSCGGLNSNLTDPMFGFTK